MTVNLLTVNMCAVVMVDAVWSKVASSNTQVTQGNPDGWIVNKTFSLTSLNETVLP